MNEHNIYLHTMLNEINPYHSHHIENFPRRIIFFIVFHRLMKIADMNNNDSSSIKKRFIIVHYKQRTSTFSHCFRLFGFTFCVSTNKKGKSTFYTYKKKMIIKFFIPFLWETRLENCVEIICARCALRINRAWINILSKAINPFGPKGLVWPHKNPFR